VPDQVASCSTCSCQKASREAESQHTLFVVCSEYASIDAIIYPYLICTLFLLLGHLVKQRLRKSNHESKILFAQQGNGNEIQQSVNKTEINYKTYRSLAREIFMNMFTQ